MFLSRLWKSAFPFELGSFISCANSNVFFNLFRARKYDNGHSANFDKRPFNSSSVFFYCTFSPLLSRIGPTTRQSSWFLYGFLLLLLLLWMCAFAWMILFIESVYVTRVTIYMYICLIVCLSLFSEQHLGCMLRQVQKFDQARTYNWKVEWCWW